ncbi:MAG TPA: S8 family serine peptidase [Oligoflexia bacterium]|nr:S8 family serine peptidase [Oligoflexia bacterium]HMP27740.1 S8 family serine peptidase [Oligoflexia bacterium]
MRFTERKIKFKNLLTTLTAALGVSSLLLQPVYPQQYRDGNDRPPTIIPTITPTRTAAPTITPILTPTTTPNNTACETGKRTPNDPKFPEQWNLQGNSPTALNMPLVWHINEKYKPQYQVNIAVISTGCAYNTDLQYKESLIPNLGDPIDNFRRDDDQNGCTDDVYYGCQFDASSSLGNNNFWDTLGPGTQMTSLLTASTNNQKQIAGMLYGIKFKIIPIGVPLLADGNTYPISLIKAFHYLAKISAKIPIDIVLVAFNCQGLACKLYLQQAINLLPETTTIIVSAGGTPNRQAVSIDLPESNNSLYPASLTKSNLRVLAVGAINKNGNKLDWSNYGPESAIAAPGDDVPVLLNTYTDSAKKSGPHIAAAHVAGVAATIKAYNPSMTGPQIIAQIKKHLRPVAELNQYFIPTSCGNKIDGGALSEAAIFPNCDQCQRVNTNSSNNAANY